MDLTTLTHRFQTISSMPLARQLSLLIGLAASISLGIAVAQWARSPDWVPLYGDMSPAAVTDVLQSLDSKGIKYRYNNQSGLISVAADKVHQTRLQLASEGLPEADTSGFNILYQEQQMGVSSFMEKARYDRALEQELARTISAMDGVRAARVHLALPKPSAFVRKRNKPAASVFLNLMAGRTLDDQQLAGVVFLVASSVPGLEADNVSVVDRKGKLLSNQNQQDGFAYTKEQFRITQNMEDNYESRISQILAPILGLDAFRAQVAADVDFTVVERTSESYAPQSKIRSEQLVEESDIDESTAAGAPGTLSNTPPGNAQLTEKPGSGDSGITNNTRRSIKREVRNYELDKTLSHIRETPGSLKRLSIAVVVDHLSSLDEQGNVQRTPRTQQQLDEITALVKEAVGFDEERGDSLNVVSASFVSAEALEPLPEPSLLEQEWVWRLGKIVLGTLGVLILIFAVLRPLMRITPPVVQAEQNPALPGANPNETGQPGLLTTNEMGEDQVTLGQAGGQQGLPGVAHTPYEQQIGAARQMVEQEPERVAQVVKNWVSSDG